MKYSLTCYQRHSFSPSFRSVMFHKIQWFDARLQQREITAFIFTLCSLFLTLQAWNNLAVCRPTKNQSGIPNNYKYKEYVGQRFRECHFINNLMIFHDLFGVGGEFLFLKTSYVHFPAYIYNLCIQFDRQSLKIHYVSTCITPSIICKTYFSIHTQKKEFGVVNQM